MSESERGNASQYISNTRRANPHPHSKGLLVSFVPQAEYHHCSGIDCPFEDAEKCSHRCKTGEIFSDGVET